MERIRQGANKLSVEGKSTMKDFAEWTETHPLATSSLLSFGTGVWYVLRRGPYRAWKLGRTSKKWSAPVRSVRSSDIQTVQRKISTLTGETFVVVRGPKGVGKTCIVDTVLEKRPGVLRFDIPPGKRYDDIMKQVYSSVSGSEKDLETSEADTKKILKWYNRFYLRCPGVVAFQADERPAPEAAE